MADFEAALWKKIRAQTGLNVHADWTDADIIRLSSLLESSTGMHMDRQRLKSLIIHSENLNWDEHPDLKLAVAKISGYESWESLQQQIRTEESKPVELPDNENPNAADLLTSRNPQSWIFGLIMLLIMVLAFFYWNKQRKKDSRPISVQSSAHVQVR